MQQNDKLEFGGQGPQPMRYGSVGSPVSTGRRSKRDRAILGSERQIPICNFVVITGSLKISITLRFLCIFSFEKETLRAGSK